MLWEKDMEKMEAQLANRETQKARIWKAFELTGDEERFRKDIASLEKDIGALKEERSNIARRIEYSRNFINIEDVRATCDLITKNLRGFSYEEKRLALSAVQVKVWIDGERVEIEGAIPMTVGCPVSSQSG